jgi:hypothetical protein
MLAMMTAAPGPRFYVSWCDQSISGRRHSIDDDGDAWHFQDDPAGGLYDWSVRLAMPELVDKLDTVSLEGDLDHHELIEVDEVLRLSAALAHGAALLARLPDDGFQVTVSREGFTADGGVTGNDKSRRGGRNRLPVCT